MIRATVVFLYIFVAIGIGAEIYKRIAIRNGYEYASDPLLIALLVIVCSIWPVFIAYVLLVEAFK